MKISKYLLAWFGLISLISTASICSADSLIKQNWFGGETYQGAPALSVTSSLIEAGGGVNNFDFHTALVSMLGEKTVEDEVAKLIEQYGENEVNTFVAGMTFAVNSGVKHATKAGIVLPKAPTELKGVKLAKTLVEAGTASDGTWWSGLLFDKALSNQIHNQVMTDIENTHSFGVDKLTHKILNQAMYDVAQALGYEDVKLAPLH